mmetsp:Transcript_11827/g.29152  ORF Transcript_11827/g.29152 Transcript_11827/m.29152 type:complete len:339 (+) Transcript_11827:648-1664(+)
MGQPGPRARVQAGGSARQGFLRRGADCGAQEQRAPNRRKADRAEDERRQARGHRGGGERPEDVQARGDRLVLRVRPSPGPREQALDSHGTLRGRLAPRPPGHLRPPPRVSDPVHHRQVAQGARLPPLEEDHPPRPQGGEHPPHGEGRGEADGLRDLGEPRPLGRLELYRWVPLVDVPGGDQRKRRQLPLRRLVARDHPHRARRGHPPQRRSRQRHGGAPGHPRAPRPEALAQGEVVGELQRPPRQDAAEGRGRPPPPERALPARVRLRGPVRLRRQAEPAPWRAQEHRERAAGEERGRQGEDGARDEEEEEGVGLLRARVPVLLQGQQQQTEHRRRRR